MLSCMAKRRVFSHHSFFLSFASSCSYINGMGSFWIGHPCVEKCIRGVSYLATKIESHDGENKAVDRLVSGGMWWVLTLFIFLLLGISHFLGVFLFLIHGM